MCEEKQSGEFDVFIAGKILKGFTCHKVIQIIMSKKGIKQQINMK